MSEDAQTKKHTEPSSEEKLIDINELADRLNVSTRTLRTMISEKSLPYLRVKGSYRFLYSSVIRKMEDASK